MCGGSPRAHVQEHPVPVGVAGEAMGPLGGAACLSWGRPLQCP